VYFGEWGDAGRAAPLPPLLPLLPYPAAAHPPPFPLSAGMGDVSGEDATSTVIGGDLPAGRWGAVGVVWWEKGREGALEACSGVCGGCGAKGEFPNK